MKIRAMEEGDLERIAELSRQLGYPVELPALRQRFERLGRDPSQALRVAELEVAGPGIDGRGAVVGWLHVQARWLLETDPFAEIMALVVDEGARRRGVGRGLVAEAERWARAAGFALLRVRSNIARAESHAFYPAIGFAQLKTQHTYVRQL